MLHPVALKTSVGAYKNRKVLSKFLEQGGVGVCGKLQHTVSKNIPEQVNVLVSWHDKGSGSLRNVPIQEQLPRQFWNFSQTLLCTVKNNDTHTAYSNSQKQTVCFRIGYLL